MTKDKWYADEETRRRFHALSDEQIQQAVSSDPDSFFPEDPEWKNAVPLGKSSSNKMIVPIALEASSIIWLRDHDIDLQSLVNGMMSGLAMQQINRGSYGENFDESKGA